MRTYDEALAASLEEPSFSNGSQWAIWSYNWCERCTNDSPELVDKGEGCPLILLAFMGRRPIEWLTQTAEQEALGDFHCVEFRDRDNPGGEEPTPVPDPPDQAALLPREPYEGVRMYAGLLEKTPAHDGTPVGGEAGGGDPRRVEGAGLQAGAGPENPPRPSGGAS